MNFKLEKINNKIKEYQIIIPPGQFYEYNPNNKTYLYKEKEGIYFLMDNPYILEYLVYQEREEDIPLVSNISYEEKEIVKLPTNKMNKTFFTEQTTYILDFKATKKELPVFKVFLDHLLFNRINNKQKGRGKFFPWNYTLFANYAKSVKHELKDKEIKKLHERLVQFQRFHYPEEALKSLFEY